MTRQGEAGDSVALAAPAALGQPQVYHVTGLIKSITPSGSHLIVEHEAISGYMDSMTMPFAVSDTASLHGLRVGDRVQFTLTIASQRAFIHTVHKVLQPSAEVDALVCTSPVKR